MNETEGKTSQFRKDMLAAFRHGINYENKRFNGDFDLEKVQDNHLPFAEWFSKHYIGVDGPPQWWRNVIHKIKIFFFSRYWSKKR